MRLQRNALSVVSRPKGNEKVSKPHPCTLHLSHFGLELPLPITHLFSTQEFSDDDLEDVQQEAQEAGCSCPLATSA